MFSESLQRIGLQNTLFIAALCFCARAAEPVGLEQMTAFERLPYLKDGVKVCSFESTDRSGQNSDGNNGTWSYLYEENGEYVLMDVDGPGCIYNFWGLNIGGYWKIYLDGETQPRITLNQDDIGNTAPFIDPLAKIWTGGNTCRWSFVPIPFQKSCEVVSSSNPDWYHIVYHMYRTAEGVATYTGTEDYSQVSQMWLNRGSDPKDTIGNLVVSGTVAINNGQSAVIYERTGAESIASIRLQLNRPSESMLNNTWIKAFWDGQAEPAILCPLGVFFGNELGDEPACVLLTHGMRDQSGKYYSYFPMPYWQSARIELANESGETMQDISFEIQYKPFDTYAYPQEVCGHFYATYAPRSVAPAGLDFRIADIAGRGHLVGGHVTAWSVSDESEEEGDVKCFIDKSSTPPLLGTGSEDYPLYCWGFTHGPVYNPQNGYDGQGIPWSLVRVHTGDWYPFQTGLRFQVEHGAYENTTRMEMSGAVLYYATDSIVLEQTDSLDIGDVQSEADHGYIITGETGSSMLTAFYEGEINIAGITDNGRAFNGHSEFTVAIAPQNNGVRLKRRMDDANGRQRANVYVDDVRVTERTWYTADVNLEKRWMDDEFEIPESYTAGKSMITIKIEFVSAVAGEWNEYYYWVYAYRVRRSTGIGGVAQAFMSNRTVRITRGPGMVKISGLHGDTEVMILGLDGKAVLSNSLRGESEVKISTGLLAAGAYVLKVAGPCIHHAARLLIGR